jgi:outer membrane immunogenic protein
LGVTRLLLICSLIASAAAFAALQPAFAQDLIAKPALEPSAEESWTGVHLGVSVGARLSDAKWTTDCLAPLALPGTCPNDIFGGSTRIGNDNQASLDTVAPRFGGYLGADVQIASFVFGIEGDASWADDERSRIGIPGTWSVDFGPGLNTARIESAWDASVRGRAGILINPRLLIYSTGGLALLQQEVSASCEGSFPEGWCATPNFDSESAIAVGWTLGGGFERMLARSWFLRGEYRYSDYASQSYILFEDDPFDSIEVTIDQVASAAYLGLSRKF